MAQAAPAPKTAPDATVNINANGQVTINQGGQPYFSVLNNESITVKFSYPPGYAECKLKLKFHEWKTSPANNGGTVVVGS